jgi:hypothetical protein
MTNGYTQQSDLQLHEFIAKVITSQTYPVNMPPHQLYSCGCLKCKQIGQPMYFEGS